MSAGDRGAEIGRMERHFQTQAEGRLPYNQGFVVVGELHQKAAGKGSGMKSLAPKRAMDEKFKKTVSAEHRHKRRPRRRHYRRRRPRRQRRRRSRRRRHRRKPRRKHRKRRRRRHRRRRRRTRKRKHSHKSGQKRKRRTSKRQSKKRRAEAF